MSFAADGKRHVPPHFVDEGPDRVERLAVCRDDLVADHDVRRGGGKAVEHAGDELFARDHAGHHADTCIGNFALGKMSRQILPQTARENVGEVVIGGFGRRIVAGVRRTELGKHEVDDAGEIGARFAEPEAIFLADRFPVQAVEFGVIE